MSLRPVLLLGLALLGSGCANTQQYARLEMAIARAQASADDALRQARAANMKADEALQLMRGSGHDTDSIVPTRDIAEQALKEAQAAHKEAIRASKRAERMFRKALAR